VPRAFRIRSRNINNSTAIFGLFIYNLLEVLLVILHPEDGGIKMLENTDTYI
jgi:hypothetical protein